MHYFYTIFYITRGFAMHLVLAARRHVTEKMFRVKTVRPDRFQSPKIGPAVPLLDPDQTFRYRPLKQNSYQHWCCRIGNTDLKSCFNSSFNQVTLQLNDEHTTREDAVSSTYLHIIFPHKLLATMHACTQQAVGHGSATDYKGVINNYLQIIAHKPCMIGVHLPKK